MKGYCESCKQNVKGVKSPMSWLCIALSVVTVIGVIPYGCYRLLLVRKNKCPLCGLKLSMVKK